MPRIAVIIPFFQREPEILARALRSVAAQTITEPFSIVIVDDGSPISGADEVAKVTFPENISVQVVRKENGGAGSARNRALDVTETVDVVALLDSDDEWVPEHLQRGVAAIDAGFDIYSSNWRLFKTSDLAFSVRDVRDEHLLKFEAIPDTYQLDCPFMEQQARGGVARISATILSRTFIGDTRFNEDLRLASEDRLFFFELATRSPKVLLSKIPEVDSGRGVNIYESVEVFSEKSILQKRDQIYAMRRAIGLATEFPQAKEHLRGELSSLRRSFAFNAWSLARRGEFCFGSISKVLRVDPPCLASLFSFPVTWAVGSVFGQAPKGQA